MEPADSCSNSPLSPPSTSSSSPLWIASPIRSRDSTSRPRRSLLTTHFSGGEVKNAAKTESPSSAVGLSKSLPSPTVSAFLDKQEEEALEPTTPPHATTFIVPPMAPRKLLKTRPAPRGKHKPRRLLFGEGDSTGAEVGEEAGPYSTRRFTVKSSNGVFTPPRQSANDFSSSPSSASDPTRRIRMRDLR